MRKISILIIVLFIPFCAMGQRQARKSKPAVKEVKKVDERTERMIAATQDVFFIDSLVVDKDAFLGKYMLSRESGKLCRYNDLFGNSDGQAGSFAHVNEMGNKCYFAMEDDNAGVKLYTSDLLNNEWTRPAVLEGINDDGGIEEMNYPFMMADGVTLYFAATGKESIGGYDIFATRLDSESGRFLEPENIGMPFNSEANDYMYAIDEIDSIGWFVTDRNQPEGKVCIYMFVPSETRQTFSPDIYSREEIESFARITRIADTWRSKEEREEALQRLAEVKHSDVRRMATMSFVVNDNTAYESASSFRSKDAQKKYEQLNSMKSRLNTLGTALDKARNYYAKANGAERKELKEEILKSEKQYESLEIEIRQTEKDIRNIENKLLTNGRL